MQARPAVRLRPAALSLVIGLAQLYGQPRQSGLSDACYEINSTAVSRMDDGRLNDAETVLSAALESPSGAEPSCAWLVVQNLSIVVSRFGRFGEAEALSKRSIRILDSLYPPDDPRLFLPLHLLASAQFYQRKISRVRETFQRMQSIRIETPVQEALLHAMTGLLFRLEGRCREAESQYALALAAWDRAGRSGTADAASALIALAELYRDDGDLKKSAETLDRVFPILNTATDTVPTDRIRLLNSRAVLHARQGDWRKAEGDLRAAIAIAEGEAQLDTLSLATLLANYAVALRKDHRRREARAIEIRLATLRLGQIGPGVVDMTELLKTRRAIAAKSND